MVFKIEHRIDSFECTDLILIERLPLKGALFRLEKLILVLQYLVNLSNLIFLKVQIHRLLLIAIWDRLSHLFFHLLQMPLFETSEAWLLKYHGTACMISLANLIRTAGPRIYPQGFHLGGYNLENRRFYMRVLFLLMLNRVNINGIQVDVFSFLFLHCQNVLFYSLFH